MLDYLLRVHNFVRILSVMSEGGAVALVPVWTQADRLMKAMDVAGVTRKQMAEFLGVHENTVTNYTSGRTPADQRTLLLWSQRCNVSYEWLKGDDSPGNRRGRLLKKSAMRPQRCARAA